MTKELLQQREHLVQSDVVGVQRQVDLPLRRDDLARVAAHQLRPLGAVGGELGQRRRGRDGPADAAVRGGVAGWLLLQVLEHAVARSVPEVGHSLAAEPVGLAV